MFSEKFTSALSKSWLSWIEFGHRVVSSQQKIIENFIPIKVITSNIIKTKPLLFNFKILPNTGMLFKGDFNPKSLDNPLAS